jgi:hypothetical protein
MQIEGRGHLVVSERADSLLNLAGDIVKERWVSLRREATAPWREGPKGTAAEVGRGIGLGLLIAALALGVGGAILALRD